MRPWRRRGRRLVLLLVALLLVAAPACASGGGSGGDVGGGSTATPTGPVAGISIRVVGANIAFDKTSIRVPAGAQVTVTFENRDRGIPHNFHVDAGPAGDFRTEVEDGPVTQVLRFAIRQPGSYRYLCDVHPTQMRGMLTVGSG